MHDGIFDNGEPLFCKRIQVTLFTLSFVINSMVRTNITDMAMPCINQRIGRDIGTFLIIQSDTAEFITFNTAVDNDHARYAF